MSNITQKEEQTPLQYIQQREREFDEIFKPALFVTSEKEKQLQDKLVTAYVSEDSQFSQFKSFHSESLTGLVDKIREEVEKEMEDRIQEVKGISDIAEFALRSAKIALSLKFPLLTTTETQ